MLISEKHRFIFVSVPKTETTTIETHPMELVWRFDGTLVPVHRHARASKINLIMGDGLLGSSVVDFVRDPLSTVASRY